MDGVGWSTAYNFDKDMMWWAEHLERIKSNTIGIAKKYTPQRGTKGLDNVAGEWQQLIFTPWSSVVMSMILRLMKK